MNDKYLVFKIAGGVVLGLLIWNAYERYQQRIALEDAMVEFNKNISNPDPLGWRAESEKKNKQMKAREATRYQNTHRPIPPGYKCISGTLMKRVDNGWTQITARNDEWYCPGNGVENCYQVSPQTTNCR